MAQTYVAFDTVSPFDTTRAASLFVRLDKTLPGGTSTGRYGFVELVEAEQSLVWAVEAWNQCMEEILAVARDAPVETRVGPHKGCAEYKLIRSDHGVRLGHSGELRTAELLDAVYVFCERVVAATKALREVTRNGIWRDIDSNRISKGKRLIERNLIARFASTSPDMAAAGDAIVLMLRTRGKRTHSWNYRMHVELGPDDVHFQNRPVISGEQHSFTRSQLLEQYQAVMKFYEWWLGETDRSLSSLIP